MNRNPRKARHTEATDALPSICRRCGALLNPGRGDFFIVEVEAYAENSPPVITAEDLARDHCREMRDIVGQLGDLSAQEAMDQVHRQMTFCLCGSCYRTWIEDPTR